MERQQLMLRDGADPMSGFNRVRIALMLCSCACLPAPWTAVAQAQQVADAGIPDQSDIIVTARKRQESILTVPVVVTAVTEEKLDRLQVTDIADIPKLVPGLVLGQQLLSIGTLVTIRGVGTSASDPGVDQSVSLNIDGLALGNGLAFSSGMFDLQQIEVLKGPQALFYGKSSPGGVLSLRTADPTDEVEVQARAGYEFEGREARGEFIFSGPLGDTLKARFASMYSAGDGYFTNNAIPAAGFGGKAPLHDREPHPRNLMLRGTALWNPSSEFSARLKLNYVYDRAIGAETSQLATCPDGAGQSFGVPFIGNDDCRMDRELNVVHMDPAYYPGIANNGVPYLRNIQKYGTLELNYNISPQLGLTSVTGYYNLHSRSLVNATHGTAAPSNIAAENRFRRRDLTEELRLSSDFSGPVNFMLGGFYQDGRLYDRVTFRGNRVSGFPALTRDAASTIDIKTYSVFGQLRWRIVPKVELAGGVRWTDEIRKLTMFDFPTNASFAVAVPRIHSSNVAPEVTLTYTPTDDLTLFAAFKQGYKSGSFSVATPVAARGNNAFGDERVRGGEIGLKSRLLDRQLLLNLAGYDYRYKGLQVGGITGGINGVPAIRVVNAGGARTYGVDFDAAYRPRAVEGLALNASVNWNHGRYTTLNNVPCYSGQTIAQGCTQFLNPLTGRYTAQDLSGTPLIRAPKWQATFGFDYELPVGSNLKATISNSNQFSSRFATFLAVGRPNEDNFQRSFIKSDISVALKDANDRWEIAVIGKNVTDKITASNCAATNLAGGNLLGGPITGSTTSGPAGYSETSCYTERGRSVWVRLTWRPVN
jgi:iron complex outermembrane recepter protein